MIAVIVLLAEAATFAFFVFYLRLAFHLVHEGRDLPAPLPDEVGDTFVRSARLAMIIGYAIFYAITIYWMVAGGQHGP